MAIEITPRVKIKLSNWKIIAGIVLVVLLMGLIAAYLYFTFSIKKMSQEFEEKNRALAPLEKAIEEKENELEPIGQKIDDFNVLLAEHKNRLDIFTFLQTTCLPSIWFSDFAFDSDAEEVIVSGRANNFATLEQQMNILEQEPVLSDLNITGLSIGEEGGIVFTLSLIFK